jgi:hypothetical protein
MQPFNATLGLKTIPKRFVPLLKNEELPRAFSDALTIVSQTPSAWEIVEVPGGGGIQPFDVPFKSIPKQLSEEQKRHGRERIDEAYKRIDAALKQLDKRIAQLERSALRRLLMFVGSGLVLSAVAILAIGVFRHSEIKLTGKSGAATLLLGTGISLLGSMYAKDRKMRTLTSRIRAHLGACLAYADYSDVRDCFMTRIEECNSAFTRIRRHIESNPTAGTDIDL